MAIDQTGISDVSQIILDLYNQDFSTETSFIQIEHVNKLVSINYAKLINDEYRQQKLINKSLTGFSWVEITSDWLTEKEFQVPETGVIEIAGGVFSFTFDSMGSGIQQVIPMINDKEIICNELIRISTNDEWKYCRMPCTNRLFYSVRGGHQVRILGKGKFPTAVKILYIPAVNSGCDNIMIPVTKQDEIVKATLQLLLIAKQQVIIDKTNDGNQNVTPASEINPAIFKK